MQGYEEVDPGQRMTARLNRYATLCGHLLGMDNEPNDDQVENEPPLQQQQQQQPLAELPPAGQVPNPPNAHDQQVQEVADFMQLQAQQAQAQYQDL
jgi:hypothetical protein